MHYSKWLMYVLVDTIFPRILANNLGSRWKNPLTPHYDCDSMFVGNDFNNATSLTQSEIKR